MDAKTSLTVQDLRDRAALVNAARAEMDALAGHPFWERQTAEAAWEKAYTNYIAVRDALRDAGVIAH